MSSINQALETVDTIEDTLLEWALFREDNDLTDDVVEQGNLILAEEKAKKAGKKRRSFCFLP